MTIARELADIIQSNGDVVISGGLEVNGTTTTINTTTFVVEDKNIELGGNATSNSQNDGAGISILLPDASPDEFATLTYVNSSDAWSFNKGVEIAGSITSSGTLVSTINGNNSSGGNLFLGATGNNSPKFGSVALRQYNSGTETEGYSLITGAASDGSNSVWIGGGFDEQNAATAVYIKSAADSNTRNGTNIAQFNLTGLNLLTGTFQVGGTTVIDSSRNITGASFVNSAVRYIANQIQSGYADNSDDSDIWINYTGYQGGTTYFRDFRVGNGKQAQLFFVDGSSGNVDVTAGDLQIGGTTVIDSSRNLTNIGTATLSSTTSTLLTLNATANNYGGISFQYGGVLKGFSGYNSGFMVFGGEAGTDTRLQAGGQYGLSISNSSRNVSIGSTTTHPEKLYVNGNIRADGAYYVNGTPVIDSSRNLTNIGTISSGGITTLGSSVFNSYSTSDPNSTSRTNYPAGNMFTHYSQANGVSIIGGQGSYTGSSLTIGEETARSANFKLIRGISDTNGTPAEEFSINGVGDAVFAGTISSGAITSSGPIKLSGSGNGQEVQVVKGQAGSFTTVTIELQFLGAGSYNYEVGVSGTNGCGIQFGGGYTNGVANFSHTGNPQVGNAWTVTSPSNNLVRLVSPSGVVGTHPTAYVKARFGLTDGFDEADISITFS